MSTLYWGLETHDPQEIDARQSFVDLPVHPGDLLAGLVSLKHKMLDGRLDPEEFTVALQEKDEELSQTFAHLSLDIEPPHMPAMYRAALQKALLDTRRFLDQILVLLRSGLGEMNVYTQDFDPLHIDQGLILAAKGEHELIELLASLSDMRDHPLSLLVRGGGFLSHLLAQRFDGHLPPKEFDDALRDWERETHAYFDRSLQQLTQAISVLQGVQRPEDPRVRQALRSFNAARMDARRGLLNLQNPSNETE